MSWGVFGRDSDFVRQCRDLHRWARYLLGNVMSVKLPCTEGMSESCWCSAHSLGGREQVVGWRDAD